MNGIMYQENFDIIPDNWPKEIHHRILLEKEHLADLKKQVLNQGVLFRELAALLGDIHTALFELQQGELFDEENIETVDDIECKNEVFGKLRELLGNEQAEKVADYFSGSQVYFSKNIAVTRKHREIKRAFREGATYRDLGTKHGYTEAHIRNIVHKGTGK